MSLHPAKVSRIAAAPAAILFFLLCVAAQQPESRKQAAWTPSKAGTVHAPAITYGADLEKQSSAELRKWAGSFAKGELREKPLDPQGTMGVVDKRFPQASDEARDAVTFLLFYLGYKEEDLEQRMLAARLTEIDRQTKEITRQLQIIWKNEQSRSASPTQGLSQEQRLAIEDQVREMESRLREYADERQLKSGLFAASRKRVEAFLRLISAVHPRMQGIEPAILKSIP